MDVWERGDRLVSGAFEGDYCEAVDEVEGEREKDTEERSG